MADDSENKIYTCHEVAEMLGLHKKTAERIARDMKLGRLLKPARIKVYTMDDIQKMRERNTKPGPKPGTMKGRKRGW